MEQHLDLIRNFISELEHFSCSLCAETNRDLRIKINILNTVLLVIYQRENVQICVMVIVSSITSSKALSQNDLVYWIYF